MNKNYLIFGIIMVVMVGVVSAVSTEVVQYDRNGSIVRNAPPMAIQYSGGDANGESAEVISQLPNAPSSLNRLRVAKIDDDRVSVMFNTRTALNYNESVTGLENAIVRVRNNETAIHLQEVLAKIDAKRELQITKLENKSADKLSDNSTLITGKGKAKFFGLIKMNKEFRYNVLVNGTVVDKPKPFDFVWSKQIIE
jgi:hypothetical protein